MLRTTALSSTAHRVAGKKSAACPRQRFRCSSISPRLPLAAAPASSRNGVRFRCARLPFQPTHLRPNKSSQRSQITPAQSVPSGQQQNTYGFGKRRCKSTVCQASRASMMDSLEEVRSVQSRHYFSLSQISSFCCCGIDGTS